MNHFVGIDLGTSYFKAGVFDRGGRLRGLGRRPVEKSAVGGRCELALPVFWGTLRAVIAEALHEAGTKAEDIEAASWSSQANSFVLLDRADESLTPLILWPDERGSGPPETLIKRPDFMEVTGLGIAPGNGAMIAKTEWFRKNQPGIWEQAAAIMSISDYLAFSLTGHRVGDLGTASMTGLLDVRRRKWWNEALDICGIKENQLSVPLNTGTSIGPTTGEMARYIGLRPHTMLFAGGLDHHMVALAAGTASRNIISESTGTVLACVDYREGYHPREGVNIASGLDADHYFRMAFDANGAAALEWYRKRHAPHLTIPELLDLAENVPPGCEGLVAKPCADRYPGLEGFENIQKKHTAGHFTRAILESTARSLSDLVQTLTGGYPAEAIAASGGGARSGLWLKIKSDTLGLEFITPESGELACKGAAMCAMGTTNFGSLDGWLETKEKITPNTYD